MKEKPVSATVKIFVWHATICFLNASRVIFYIKKIQEFVSLDIVVCNNIFGYHFHFDFGGCIHNANQWDFLAIYLSITFHWTLSFCFTPSSEMSKFDLFCNISITIMCITFTFGITMIHHSIHIVLYLFDLDMTLTKICDLEKL